MTNITLDYCRLGIDVGGTNTENLAPSQTATHTGLQVNDRIVQAVGILDAFEQIGRAVHFLCLDDSICGPVDVELAVTEDGDGWYGLRFAGSYCGAGRVVHYFKREERLAVVQVRASATRRNANTHDVVWVPSGRGLRHTLRHIGAGGDGQRLWGKV